MWRLIFLFFCALAGFWFGKTPEKGDKKGVILSGIHPEKEFPVTEHKSFVIVLYSYNEALWCERALRSIFEQDYDHYRVIVIDDGSIDRTEERAKQFILDNNQDEKVILIRNETRLGEVASLYRAVDGCLDREIILPINAKNWLSSPSVLQRFNRAYQNPDVWMSVGQSIEYPSYKLSDEGPISYYAALFKQLRLKDLFINGQFALSQEAYLTPLEDLCGGRVQKMGEPVAFINLSPPIRQEPLFTKPVRYTPLSAFPAHSAPTKRTDIIVFSSDRPIQLYACLESIQRYISGFEQISVLYQASDSLILSAYEKLKDTFPTIRFTLQEEDFKAKFEKTVFQSPSEYLLLAVDNLIVKDFVDLKLCMDQMEKTGAYGFYLHFGRHIQYSHLTNQPQPLPASQPLGGGIYAWNIEMGESDWAAAPSLDMTLYKKGELKKAITQLKYKTPNDWLLSWDKAVPERPIGLYFERSKAVNIPSSLNREELLVKFNQGLKIDIDPLYKVENGSPYLDYVPEFIIR